MFLKRKEITVLRNLVFVVFALLQAATTRAADTSPLPPPVYTVSKSFPLAGNGGWDYLALEASGGRLFVSRADHVDVVETVSGKLVGTIANTAGIHGIAFAPALKRGFTSNGRSNSVTVFELDTLRVIQEVPVSGKKPDAILYEPRNNHVITANGASSDLSVLDAASLQEVATIALPGPPEFMTTDAAGMVYVKHRDEFGQTRRGRREVAGRQGNLGLAGPRESSETCADAAHHRLSSVCETMLGMAVTDSASGKQVAKVVIGRGPDAAAFDADLGLVFSSNGQDGTLTVIHLETPYEYRVGATVTTQVSARSMTLDPATHRIFLAAAKLGPAPPAPEGAASAPRHRSQ